jgi:hypothetical protein
MPLYLGDFVDLLGDELPMNANAAALLVAQRQREARAVLIEWINKQGQDRCWYYPDLFRRLCEVLGVRAQVEPCLPPRAEFEEGCRRYADEEYDSGPAPQEGG